MTDLRRDRLKVDGPVRSSTAARNDRRTDTDAKLKCSDLFFNESFHIKIEPCHIKIESFHLKKGSFLLIIESFH